MLEAIQRTAGGAAQWSCVYLGVMRQRVTVRTDNEKVLTVKKGHKDYMI